MCVTARAVVVVVVSSSQGKLSAGMYPHLFAFVRDVRLVLHNCVLFNVSAESKPLRVMALALSSFFEQWLSTVLDGVRVATGLVPGGKRRAAKRPARDGDDSGLSDNSDDGRKAKVRGKHRRWSQCRPHCCSCLPSCACFAPALIAVASCHAVT